MKAHLPFSPEEEAWRADHFELDVPEHHWAPVAAGDGATDDTAAIRRAQAEGGSVRRFALANPVHGFDVSSYQPAGPDFRQGGRQFAIFKATEGTGYFDRNFNANRAKAHAQGLPFVGLYHFARPGSHGPEAEASYFLSHVGSRQPGECAVLDYETSPWNVAWIVKWIQVVQAAGWPVEFYSYLGMISANPTAGIPETGCGLWVAAYGCREPGNDRWAAKDLWQHTDGAGSVCGNDGGWDCSIGDLARLTARVGAAPGPPPPPPPTTQEEPVGAYALPVLEPGETYTFRPPPARGSGGIHFGSVFFSFGCDFVPDPGVPLRIAVYKRGSGWEVPYGGGSFDVEGAWHNENDAVPPLWIATGGDVAALEMDASHTKVSVVHCGKAGRVVPLVEYQT